MTDPARLRRIGAEIAQRDVKWRRQDRAARDFLAFACGALDSDAPGEPVCEPDDALRKIRVLRRELLATCREHFPHLLKPGKGDVA